jgi:hypothetical protein
MAREQSPSGSRTRPTVLRRARVRGAARLGQQVRAVWQRVLEWRALAVLLFLGVGTWCVAPSGTFVRPRVEVGEVAERDYVAPRDLLVLDQESTRDKKQRAREDLRPVYEYEPGVAADLTQRLTSLFREGRRAVSREPGGAAAAPALANVRSATALTLTPEQLALLARRGFSQELEDRLAGLVSQLLGRGVVAQKLPLLEHRSRGVVVRDAATGAEEVRLDLYTLLEHPREVRDYLTAAIAGWPAFRKSERAALVELLATNLSPNLYLDRQETQARRAAAEAGAAPVYTRIRKGQVVARQGDPIDAAAARAVAAFAGERRLRERFLVLAGGFLLLALLALVVWLGLRRERVYDQSRRRLYGEALLLLLFSLIGARFTVLVGHALAGAFQAPPLNSAQSYAYAVPYASLALLAALLYGRNAALLLGLVFSVLVGRIATGDGMWAVLYSLAGSLTAVYALERAPFKERSVVTRVGLWVGLVNALVVLMMTALAGEARGLAELGFDLLCAATGGLLVTAVVSFATPILESLFSVTTDIKLIELSNTNLPLLRRLALEAPGTFQHSLSVANLCKAACEAIGADPVMAYTGALYHDVGKVYRPEYFVENQRSGQNPHDRLQASMSALILVNHIKEGLDLAGQYDLPQPVREAIQQHHGTRLMKFFYARAQEQAGAGAPAPAEAAFRYPGPKPRHKVMGVLMLADAVEAAGRTLTEPTPAKIRGLVRALVDDIQRDGQLDETDLTLADLRGIAETFVRVLSTLYHRRIDYPGFDFNTAQARPRLLRSGGSG